LAVALPDIWRKTRRGEELAIRWQGLKALMTFSNPQDKIKEVEGACMLRLIIVEADPVITSLHRLL
jgi:hypothetical protein